MVAPVAIAQTSTSENVVVTGDDIGSAYGAPGGFRGRGLLLVRRRPPMCCRHGRFISVKSMRATHSNTDRPITCLPRKWKWALPYRFGVAVGTQFERFNGGGGNRR